MDAIQNLIADVTDKMTDNCFIRWKHGARQAATLREHAILYFSPSLLAQDFIKNAGNIMPNVDMKFVHGLYMSIVEANRQTFIKYSDEKAEAVYKEWHDLRGHSM